MSYAIELLNGGSLHCGFWHYPIAKQHREHVPEGDFPHSSPVNSKKNPPLVFETACDAHVAADFYDTLYAGSHIEARIKPVEAQPTHRLTDDGFKAVPMPKDSLFSNQAL